MTRESLSLLLPFLILVCLFSLISCGETTAPEKMPATVSMPGTIDLGTIPGMFPQDLTINLGANSASPDTAGMFTIVGNRATPGLVVAVDGDPDRPVLFSVIPNPSGEQAVELNLHTTALSMVFMAPYVVTADPDQAVSTLTQIEALPEFSDFENHLIQRMSTGAGALLAESSTADSLFMRVIAAYIVKHVPDIDPPEEGLGIALPEAGSSAAQDIVIDPSYTRGGLKVTYEGGNTFKMTNDLGRWVYVNSPEGFFFAQPIDDLIDILKFKNPFLPSETTFSLNLGIGDTTTVGAYGYGWHPAEDNQWEDLTLQEQDWARLGGFTTLTLEFIPAALSVILNVRSGFDDSIPSHDDIFSFMGSFTGSQALNAKIGDRILAGDAFGISWLFFKAFLNEFTSSPNFRTKVAVFFGIELTESAVGTLVSYAVPPIKMFTTLDAAVAAGKTVLGFRNGRFKTMFTIYREATAQDYGSITGFVFDKAFGDPLPGASVILEGDEGNPLNPRLTDVTNENGAYFFENITAGEKTIRASKEGYDGASVTVNVVGNSTIEAPHMELSKESGTVSGRIINDILERHNVDQGLFQGEVPILVNEIGGEDRSFFRTATDGTYNIGIPPGTYWVVAAHEDYSRDSVQVIVKPDEPVQASKDLLLFPQSFAKGTIKFDMDNNDAYEITDSYSAVFTKASKLITDEPCGTGPNRSFIRIIAATTRKQIILNIAPDVVDGPGLFDLGAFADVSCSGSSVPAGLFHLNTDLQCTNLPMPIIFSLPDFPPEAEGCNCGITSPGEVIFDRFGTELADVIEGSIFGGTLAGWRGCSCNCTDDDDDGQYECDVECVKAQIRIDFKVLVGSAPF